MTKDLSSIIRENVKQNRLKEACEELIASRLSEKGIKLHSRYKEIEDLKLDGIINQKDIDLRIRQIRSELLAAAKELEPDENNSLKKLTQPPFIINKFIGREKELEQIIVGLEKHSNIFLISGRGGVGKTSLAAQFYDRCKEKYTHIAWLYSESGIRNSLLRFWNIINPNYPEFRFTQRGGISIFQKLNELNGKFLIIIDNVNSLSDLETNIPGLQHCRKIHIIITTRVKKSDLEYFNEDNSIRLEGLPPGESLELFKYHYRNFNNNKKALFFQMYKSIWGNTLLVELLARYLSKVNNRLEESLPLEQLIKKLEKEGILNLKSTSKITSPYKNKNWIPEYGTIEEIVGKMYQLSEMTKNERLILSIFSLLPAEQIEYEKLKTIIKDEIDFELSNTILLLETKGLLEGVGKSFKLSPIIQDVIRRKNKDFREDCRPLIIGLTVQLEYEGDTGYLLNSTNHENAEIFAHYASSVCLKLSKQKGGLAIDRDLAILNERLGTFYESIGDLESALKFYKEDQKLSTKLSQINGKVASYKYNEAISYLNLGSVYSSLSDTNDAREAYSICIKILKNIAKKYPDFEEYENGLIVSYKKLGSLSEDEGDLEQAIKNYRKSNQLAKQLLEKTASSPDAEVKNNLAKSYAKLGAIYSALGNLDQALENFSKYCQLEKQLLKAFPDNINYKYELAFSYRELGSVYLNQEDVDIAFECFVARLRLMKSLYLKHPKNIKFKEQTAESYLFLSELYLDMGNPSNANFLLNESLKITNELQLENPDILRFKFLLAISNVLLGKLANRLFNWADSKELFLKACGSFVELIKSDPLKPKYRNRLATSYERLGYLYSLFNDNEKAKYYYQKYNLLVGKLHEEFPQIVEFKNNLAFSYFRLGEQFLKLDYPKKTIESYNKAKKHWQELLEDFPNNSQYSNYLDMINEKLAQR